MRILSIISISILLLFSGCGTKRKYFEPTDIKQKLSYSKTLPSSIKSISRYGATLKNNQIITMDGLSKVVLENGFHFIGKFDGYLLSANDLGVLRVLSESGKKVYEKTFPNLVASASLKGDILAVIDASNILYLVKMSSNDVYFISPQDKTYALDARIAAPYFLNSLVIFPTLDGKIIIVDKNEGKKIRQIIVSNEMFFNNIIYLDVVNDKLIASTQKRVITISAKDMSFLNDDIKDVISFDDRVIVLTKDGRVLSLDLDLQVDKKKKFTYAVLLSTIHNDKLYIVERNGHLIQSDKNLENVNIYKLPHKINDLLFMSKNKIFYDNKSIDIKDIL